MTQVQNFFDYSSFFLSPYPGRDHRKDAGRINRGTDFYAVCVFRRNNQRIPIRQVLAL